MFDTSPIIWLQSWSSSSLTIAMNAVSLLGYAPSVVAIAALYTFGWRLRRGIVLLLIVAIANVATGVLKSTFEAPRPRDLDTHVRSLSTFEPRTGLEDEPETPALRRPPEELFDFGFPSGHVAVTTALFAGLWWMERRRWIVATASFAVPMMMLSRMYLGRHFPVDVAGGVVVGLLSVWLVRRVLHLDAISRRGSSSRSFSTLLVIATVVALIALATGQLQPFDAGRLCGFAAATAFLLRGNVLREPPSLAIRCARVLVALIVVGATVALISPDWRIDVSERIWRCGAATALNAGVLLVPLLVVRTKGSS